MGREFRVLGTVVWCGGLQEPLSSIASSHLVQGAVRAPSPGQGPLSPTSKGIVAYYAVNNLVDLAKSIKMISDFQ